MKHYDRLTILRNRHRVRDLRVFRELVVAYYERSEYDADDLQMDWEGAQAARAQINRMLPRIADVVEAARIGTAAATGNPGIAVGKPDALQHIFTDRYVSTGGQEVLDIIDMTIGVYEASRFGALARTVNPLYYVGTLLGFVFGLPKQFFNALGFGRPSHLPRIQAEDVKRLEAAAARLAETEDLIEMRFSELRERQARQVAEHAQQLTELAERLDFAERVLTQQRALPNPPDATTPV